MLLLSHLAARESSLFHNLTCFARFNLPTASSTLVNIQTSRLLTQQLLGNGN
ncbi:ORF57 [Fowl aviadenovirus 5]|uniref:ORF57 n=2 Tax=Fowl aviadenovirus 5 TaxID=172861 RepID=A0A6M3Z503_9ADEN|nr:ORF57 [Fowl aviadenovirus 5]AGL34700.1 ORF57 [Fowl aviadenovirus 5]QJP03692.1 ORF57 [Fowl aviadenovirus 5]